MAHIPSDIKTAEAARHWLRVNGHSEERIESILANWSALEESAPIIEPDPVVEEDEDEWEYEEDEEEEDPEEE
jgi:hypothetical protein